MLYFKARHKGETEFGYSLNDLIFNHSEEWNKIFLNVLTVKIALLANSQQRMKLKEVNVLEMVRNVVEETIPIFDKFLIEVKGYRKDQIIDEYDGSDIDLYQDLDYTDVLCLFENAFTDIEVK